MHFELLPFVIKYRYSTFRHQSMLYRIFTQLCITRIHNKKCSSISFCRWLSSSELKIALRPFYFAVHPDLFERFPKERNNNEHNIMKLNNFIETVLNSKPIKPTNVTFYIRNQKILNSFKSINISLIQKDIHILLKEILSACSIDTKYLDSLPKRVPEVKRHQESDIDDDTCLINRTYCKMYFCLQENKNWSAESWDSSAFTCAKECLEETTLSSWLTKYSQEAQERAKICQPTREEINRLQEKICKRLRLRDLLWDCGWSTNHFTGCLQSFQSLIIHHPEEMGNLAGRTVVFGNESGISLQGDIILNSGEVRSNWLDFIRNIEKNEKPLKRVPALEAALSRYICDIKVSQRVFRPKLLAEYYECHLRVLTTSLGDYRGRYKFPFEDLSNFQLVVEGEAGPLMLSPSGQFITPASCPISLLVSFISANLEEARIRLDQYVNDLEQEKNLRTQCLQTFNLVALTKEDNVTPKQMATFCRQLLNRQGDILTKSSFKQSRVWVTTHYYSLLNDGEMCIPFNWK